MKKKRLTTKQMTVLGLMIAVLVLMSYTPLGYLNIGPLAISFNMIPVAIAAIACGPMGGAILGAVFGLTSFGQCIGIGRCECHGGNPVCHQSGTCLYPEICAAPSGRTAFGLHIQRTAQGDQEHNTCRLYYRFSGSIPQYPFLYDRTGRLIWKYRVCAEPDRRTQYHCLYLRFCRCECHL